jgi:hypothetical protein
MNILLILLSLEPGCHRLVEQKVILTKDNMVKRKLSADLAWLLFLWTI